MGILARASSLVRRSSVSGRSPSATPAGGQQRSSKTGQNAKSDFNPPARSSKVVARLGSKDGGGKYRVEKSDSEWKAELGEKKYRMLRQKGTEPPRSGEYDKFHPKVGHFTCGGCALPLFTASSKFKSTCGWPSFDQVIYTEERGCHVSVNQTRGSFEIVCTDCRGHLGHVFYGEKCTPTNERH